MKQLIKVGKDGFTTITDGIDRFHVDLRDAGIILPELNRLLISLKEKQPPIIFNMISKNDRIRLIKGSITRSLGLCFRKGMRDRYGNIFDNLKDLIKDSKPSNVEPFITELKSALCIYGDKVSISKLYMEHLPIKIHELRDKANDPEIPFITNDLASYALIAYSKRLAVELTEIIRNLYYKAGLKMVALPPDIRGPLEIIIAIGDKKYINISDSDKSGKKYKHFDHKLSEENEEKLNRFIEIVNNKEDISDKINSKNFIKIYDGVLMMRGGIESFIQDPRPYKAPDDTKQLWEEFLEEVESLQKKVKDIDKEDLSFELLYKCDFINALVCDLFKSIL